MLLNFLSEQMCFGYITESELVTHSRESPTIHVIKNLHHKSALVFKLAGETLLTYWRAKQRVHVSDVTTV